MFIPLESCLILIKLFQSIFKPVKSKVDIKRVINNIKFQILYCFCLFSYNSHC